MNNNDPNEIPLFYAGQKVVCIDGYPKTGFEEGEEYIVSSYEYKMNPVNGLWFWYIGIIGYHEWIRPSIFAPIISPMQEVSFEKITSQNPISVN